MRSVPWSPSASIGAIGQRIDGHVQPHHLGRQVQVASGETLHYHFNDHHAA